MLFSEMGWKRQFDSFWCCSSVLHLTPAEQKEAFGKLALALKPSGIGYVSFKLRTGARLDRGRYFYDMDEARLRCIIAETQLTLRSCLITQDQCPGKDTVNWVNAVLELKKS